MFKKIMLMAMVCLMFSVSAFAFNVSVSAPGPGAGGDCDVEGVYEIAPDLLFAVFAFPDTGYRFGAWEGVPAEMQHDNPLVVTVTGDMNISPTFVAE